VFDLLLFVLIVGNIRGEIHIDDWLSVIRLLLELQEVGDFNSYGYGTLWGLRLAFFRSALVILLLVNALLIN